MVCPTSSTIHLGVGRDGHTASLVPADPVLKVADRYAALTREYAGHRRMTLTYRALDLWVVTGSDKAPVLPLVLARDPSIPAGRIRAERQLVIADEATARDLLRGVTAEPGA